MEREQMTIRLPADLKEKIQREADKRGFSFNGLVIEFLRCGLEQSQEQK
jgi:predicted HicB family RNase H-like nuclease